MASPESAQRRLPIDRLVHIAVLIASALFVASGFTNPAFAANTSSYFDSPFPPVEGIVLPDTPTTADRVVYRRSLGQTFTNACYPETYSGPASIEVDATNRIVRVDFDESGASPIPNCPAVFLPVSYLQISLDPLPAGEWTLEVEGMLSAYFFPIPAVSVPFEVSPAGGPAVPIGGVGSLSALLAGALAIATASLRMRPGSGPSAADDEQP